MCTLSTYRTGATATALFVHIRALQKEALTYTSHKMDKDNGGRWDNWRPLAVEADRMVPPNTPAGTKGLGAGGYKSLHRLIAHGVDEAQDTLPSTQTGSCSCRHLMVEWKPLLITVRDNSKEGHLIHEAKRIPLTIRDKHSESLCRECKQDGRSNECIRNLTIVQLGVSVTHFEVLLCIYWALPYPLRPSTLPRWHNSNQPICEFVPFFFSRACTVTTEVISMIPAQVRKSFEVPHLVFQF